MPPLDPIHRSLPVLVRTNNAPARSQHAGIDAPRTLEFRFCDGTPPAKIPADVLHNGTRYGMAMLRGRSGGAVFVEQVDGVVRIPASDSGMAWRKVLTRLQGGVPECNGELETLKVIAYLDAKPTPEGERLKTMVHGEIQALAARLPHAASDELLEILTFAMDYGEVFPQAFEPLIPQLAGRQQVDWAACLSESALQKLLANPAFFSARLREKVLTVWGRNAYEPAPSVHSQRLRVALPTPHTVTIAGDTHVRLAAGNGLMFDNATSAGINVRAGESGRILQKLPLEGRTVLSMAASDAFLVAATRNEKTLHGDIVVYDAKSLEALHTLPCSNPLDVAICGSYALSTHNADNRQRGQNGELVLWDLTTGQATHKYPTRMPAAAALTENAVFHWELDECLQMRDRATGAVLLARGNIQTFGFDGYGNLATVNKSGVMQTFFRDGDHVVEVRNIALEQRDMKPLRLRDLFVDGDIVGALCSGPNSAPNTMTQLKIWSATNGKMLHQFDFGEGSGEQCKGLRVDDFGVAVIAQGKLSIFRL